MVRHLTLVGYVNKNCKEKRRPAWVEVLRSGFLVRCSKLLTLITDDGLRTRKGSFFFVLGWQSPEKPRTTNQEQGTTRRAVGGGEKGLNLYLLSFAEQPFYHLNYAPRKRLTHFLSQ